MEKKRKRRIVLNILFIVLTLVFIWTRSLKSIPESRAESESFMAYIAPFLELFVGKGNVTNHLVRKLAHFCEYGLLGVESSILLLQCFSVRLTSVPAMLVCGFFSGAIDENIQYFTGRGNQFSDVLLDFSGYLVGSVGMIVLVCLFQKWKNSRKKDR